MFSNQTVVQFVTIESDFLQEKSSKTGAYVIYIYNVYLSI